MTDLVTILGSCRQTSIESLLPTTQILSEINCPHYSKEILQQIKYLKYRDIPREYTRHCFRNNIINNVVVNDDTYTFFKKQFDDTTFFLIEIASRIAYKWNGLYLHHIAEEDRYHFDDRANIIKEDLTDEVIEQDIIEIKNELYPRPFIIISHFATYETGKRYDEVICLLERICHKLNIPFINQMDVVAQHSDIQMVEIEPLLEHYTLNGDHIIGDIMNKINEVKEKNAKPKLYQVYYTSAEKVRKHTFHGFGDFIRGTIHLYQRYKNELDLKVNFSNHYLSRLFLCNNHLSIEECENTKYLFDGIYNFLEYTHVFTNCFEVCEMDDDCRDFIITNCLTPTIQFEKKIIEHKSALCIENGAYSVIHIRLNDDETFDKNRYARILEMIDKIHNDAEPNNRLLLIASNDVYSNVIDLPYILKTNLKPGHVGLDTITFEQCENTMVEFMLMSTCNKIYQLSVYGWGSGFSDTIHKIYNIPIEKYAI
jgi:hypothetical protein